MIKCNSNNERIKRLYYEWQREANQRGSATIDNMRKALTRYEFYTKYQDFKTFNKHKAVGFKKDLIQTRTKLRNNLSKSTVLSTLNNLKDFFRWLILQNGYKRLDVREIEYFNLSGKESRIAQAKKRPKVPTIEQIGKVISLMPLDTEIGRRNRTIIAFTLLTGMRDSAIASLKLKHIKLSEELVEQLSAEVNTKNSKTIYTYFFPVGDDIKKIVIDWVDYLYKTKLFGEDAPLFPRTKLVLDKNNAFTADGVEPIHWKTANKIRNIFKEAFKNAGIEYFNPHSFRNTLVRLGEQICKTPEEFKAWSQNLGHEQVLTTFNSYGQIDEYRQGEIIRNIPLNRDNKKDDILNRLENLLNKNEQKA
ncbi:MAG: site-specific integrase [Candidatus Brocadiia bacterium]